MAAFSKLFSLFRKERTKNPQINNPASVSLTSFNTSMHEEPKSITVENISCRDPYFEFDLGKIDLSRNEDITITLPHEKFFLAFIVGKKIENPGVARHWTSQYNMNFRACFHYLIARYTKAS